jgi:hypothetical protein
VDDDQAIAELLASVRKVRTTLAIELSAAAGALDDGRPEIARDILAATSDDLASAGQRALCDHTGDHTRPVTPRRRIRHRRLILALPLVPLVGAIAMTAAAALSGGGITGTHSQHRPATAAAGQSPYSVAPAQPPSSATTQRTGTHDSATTTLHRLEHVVSHDPKAAQVIAVAADLHQQLTAMIAMATNSARLDVVQKLLSVEQRVLEASKVPGTQFALAASREIARLLEQQPSAKSAAPAPTTHVAPRTVATPRPTVARTRGAATVSEAKPATPNRATVGRVPTSMTTNKLSGKGLFGWQ